MKKIKLLAAISMFISSAYAVSFKVQSISGVWKCGPYTMEGPASSITSTDTYDFNENGSFIERAETKRKFRNIPQELNTVIDFKGNWSVQENILYIETLSAKFISSDSPVYTVEKGQSHMNDALKVKKLTKYELSGDNNSLAFKLINSSISDINNMVFTCDRLTN